MLTPRLAPCAILLCLSASAVIAHPVDSLVGVKPVGIPPAVTFNELAIPSGTATGATSISPAMPVRPSASLPRLKATLVQHVAAGKQPTTSLLVDDGATLVVSNRGDNTVSVFDATTLLPTKTITNVGYGAWGMAAKDDATLLVANWAGSTIALVDRKSGTRVGEVSVGMKPSYMVLSADKHRVYAAGNFSGDVTISDVTSKRILRTLEVGRRPMGVALSPDGRWLYVASCESRLIAKIDLKNEVVLERFAAPLASTTNLVLTADGSTLLAASEDNRLIVMDTTTGDKSYAKVGLEPAGVAITPDGSTALVANYGDDTVSLVDMRTMETYDRVAVGRGPIDVQTDGSRFYACNDKAGSVSVFRLDPIGTSIGASSITGHAAASKTGI